MKNTKKNICAVLAALIWGTAFVGQSVSADYVGAFTFTCMRSIVATITLFAAALISDRLKKGEEITAQEKSSSRRSVIVGGILCGILLTAATNLQQIGLVETSAGKAGFITTLYVVLVPIFAMFLGKRAPIQVWVAVVIATAGLYFLCVSENFTITKGDFLIFLCAIVFAGHILVVDHFVAKANAIKMSCVQFLTSAVLSGACMLAFETIDWSAIAKCIIPILYVGIFSSGVAYTLQMFAQRDSDPTVITILLSLESVFSVLAGAIILKDTMLPREYLGCVLMFLAVVLAQLPTFKCRKTLPQN